MWPILLKRFLPYIVVVGIVVSFAWFMYKLGATHVQTQWDAHTAHLEAAFAAERARLTALTSKIQIEYRDKIVEIKTVGETIIEQVPVYITKEDDAKCTINTGFVELHNAAAEGRMPNPGGPTVSNGGPSGVPLSAVGRTVVGNYNNCHVIRQQLSSLQAWVRGLSP